jgi:hypothetical protein
LAGRYSDDSPLISIDVIDAARAREASGDGVAIEFLPVRADVRGVTLPLCVRLSEAR